jgi:hypothetical protein
MHTYLSLYLYPPLPLYLPPPPPLYLYPPPPLYPSRPSFQHFLCRYRVSQSVWLAPQDLELPTGTRLPWQYQHLFLRYVSANAQAWSRLALTHLYPSLVHGILRVLTIWYPARKIMYVKGTSCTAVPLYLPKSRIMCVRLFALAGVLVGVLEGLVLPGLFSFASLHLSSSSSSSSSISPSSLCSVLTDSLSPLAGVFFSYFTGGFFALAGDLLGVLEGLILPGLSDASRSPLELKHAVSCSHSFCLPHSHLQHRLRSTIHFPSLLTSAVWRLTFACSVACCNLWATLQAKRQPPNSRHQPPKSRSEQRRRVNSINGYLCLRIWHRAFRSPAFANLAAGMCTNASQFSNCPTASTAASLPPPPSSTSSSLSSSSFPLGLPLPPPRRDMVPLEVHKLNRA